MKGLKPQEFTPDMAQDIISKYKDLQGVKRDNFTKMAQTISLAENMMYYDKSGNEERYGYDKVLQAATDDFFYKAKPELLRGIASSILEHGQAGIFLPDNPASDQRIIQILNDKFSSIQPSGIDMIALLSAAFQEELRVPVKGSLPEAEPGLTYRP